MHVWYEKWSMVGIGYAMLPYERFEAWQRCHELVLEVYRVTKTFPQDEKIGLTSQSRRAAFSAAANIAEGSARRGPGEFRRFLDISLGSLSELAYALLVGRDVRFLSDDDWGTLDALRDHAGKLTWGLYRAVSNSRRK